MNLSTSFLPAIKKRFITYKHLGDKSFEQISDADFFYKPSSESNNIAIIIQHIYGNALSRFTNFLSEDGEKEWRKRDAEFEATTTSKEDLISFWEAAWKKVFEAIDQLSDSDLAKTIYIRSEPLLVFDALLRQLAHYAYHVGQIVLIARSLKNEQWISLSIPKNKSTAYNQQMNHP